MATFHKTQDTVGRNTCDVVGMLVGGGAAAAVTFACCSFGEEENDDLMVLPNGTGASLGCD